MNKAPWKTGIILVMLTLIMPGCLDIWITSKVNPDGSIEQIIVFEGDSTEIVDVPFALMKEEGWDREWTKPEKDKHKLIVSRKFKSVKELNASMNPADSSEFVVRVNATLQRKFRWFFTRYVYTETVLEANPFEGLNYKDFLTDEDIRLISLTEEARKTDPGYDTVKYKTTEKNFEDFLFRSMYEDFYQLLTSVLADDKTLTLSKQELDSQKDRIFHYLVDSTKGDTPDEILEGIGKITEHPDIQIIRAKYLDRFDSFKAKNDFFNASSDDNYKFAIRMPGLLLQTNSPKIEGSETSWELTYYEFFFKDYTLTAESRMVNAWAFIVAGIILLIALISMVTAFIRKR